MDKEAGADQRTDQKQFHEGREILKYAADLKVSEMKSCYQPNNDERQKHRRADAEDSDKIFSERHGRERDRRCEPNRCGNESCHKPEGRMINLR